MKSWQEWGSSLAGWFRERPTAARWGVVTLVALTLISVIANQKFSSPTEISLFESRVLTPDEVGLMQVAFGKSGLNEYEIRGTQVRVPRQFRGAYLKALADHGAVPRDLQSQAEVTSAAGIFQTRQQLRAVQLNRKKRTIRDMVLQLRFVDRAMVEYDEASGSSPFEDMQRTAIVNVGPAENRNLNLSEVKAIRDTVCGAVAGLQPDDITIIDTFSSKSYTGVIASDAEKFQPHEMAQMQAERKYELKIRSALAAYPGIRVNVEVMIDPVVRRIRDERKIHSKPMVIQKMTHREFESNMPSTTPSRLRGFFSLATNVQGNVEKLESPKVVSETTESAANGTFETTESAGPMVKYVNVSIGIPERCVKYFVNQNIENANAEGLTATEQRQTIFQQLKEDIQQKVKPLVPAGELPASQHFVVTVDREIHFPESITAGDKPAEEWAGQWVWLTLIGGSLCLIIFIRPFGKGRQGAVSTPNPETVNLSSETAERTYQPPSVTEATSSASRRAEMPTPHFSIKSRGEFVTSSQVESPLDVTTQHLMRDQLDQWCRDNPHAAAATIRQWLDKKAG